MLVRAGEGLGYVGHVEEVELLGYVERELPSELMEEIRRHLESCSECSDIAAGASVLRYGRLARNKRRRRKKHGQKAGHR